MAVFTHMDLLETRWRTLHTWTWWRPLPKTYDINKMAYLVFTCVHVTVAADERVGHPHPDWDPAGRGAQGSGQKCQEGALHAGQHSAVQTTFEKKSLCNVMVSTKDLNPKNRQTIGMEIALHTDNFYRCRHKDYVKIYFLANLSLFFYRFSPDLVKFST